MKKLLIPSIFVVSILSAFMIGKNFDKIQNHIIAKNVEKDSKFDKLIHAIMMVESNGDNNAVGDKGESIGCMQISKSVVDDVNKISSVKYTYNDRYNRAKSIEIFKIYVNHYATVKRLGHEPTFEDIARIWNGGPNGYKKNATKTYWIKVKSYLH